MPIAGVNLLRDAFFSAGVHLPGWRPGIFSREFAQASVNREEAVSGDLEYPC
jgi:hypothetical protein